MARLVYMDQTGRQRTVLLDPLKSQWVIGRHPDCDLISSDASVSRRHCVISWEDQVHRVTDLGAVNGTLLNGAHISREALRSRDIVRCGSLVLQFLAGDDDVVDDDFAAAYTPEPQLTRVAQLDDEPADARLARLLERLEGAEARAQAAEQRLEAQGDLGQTYRPDEGPAEAIDTLTGLNAGLTEQLADLAEAYHDLEHELVALELRFADTEDRAAERTLELEHAAAWLRATGARLEAVSRAAPPPLDSERSIADLPTANREVARLRSALAEARQGARAAGKARMEARKAASKNETLTAEVETLRSVSGQREQMAESLRDAFAELKKARAAAVEFETRAIEAETALAGVKRSMRPEIDADPETAERLAAMSARLGAVTRRARIQQAQDEQVRKLTCQIDGLELALSESRQEVTDAQDATLSLLAEHRAMQARLDTVSAAGAGEPTDEAAAAEDVPEADEPAQRTDS